jgi:hypothetical protein
MVQVAGALVLLVMVVTHQVQLVEMVVLVVAAQVGLTVPHLRVAQEFFTSSIKRIKQ